MFNSSSWRYEKAAKLGFRFVEISLPYEVKAEELKREADRHSLKHILINAPAGSFFFIFLKNISYKLFNIYDFNKSLIDF